jgi:hypothetical protein
MSVDSGSGKLRTAGRDLRRQWSEVKSAWHDENCRHFEEKYIAPWLARLRKAELTMGHMAALIRKVRHDCE